MDPGIAIRRIGGIQLVGAADPAHRLTVDDRIIDRKGEVAGDAEDISDPDVMETR